jgi:Predicted sugar phosphatases of the HAD superfamily
VLDVDGTVVRGDEPLPGAVGAVERLRAAGIPVVFCSNNPTAAAPAYVDRLAGAGFDPTADEIVTAATATAAYLRDHHAGESAYVFGEESVEARLREHTGLRFESSPAPASVVIAAIDYEFGYEEMRRAIREVDDQTAFVGTDPDPVIPTGDGPAPGSGAIVNALAGVLGREPDAVPGKPSATALELVTDRLGVPGDRLLVVGDRPSTDVALGERAGATTALVTTGVTDETAAATADPAPEYVCESLEAVVDRVL